MVDDHKLHVLFVDDEQDLLDGLKSRLRKNRKHWDMRFANSGIEGLTLLEHQSSDIIITDMLMPQMNGVEFLERVKKKHPNTIRMVLSGHAEQNQVIKSLSVAHRFFSKPCDIDLLQASIKDCQNLRSSLSNEECKKILAQVEILPIKSDNTVKLIDLLNTEDASLNEIVQLTLNNPALCAKILQMANSPMFGQKNTVSDVTNAVTLLGTNLLLALAINNHLAEKIEGDNPTLSKTLLEITHKAYRIANIAADLAEPSACQYALATGILHNIGKLIFLSDEFDKHYGVRKLLCEKEITWSELEQQVIGVDHRKVGSYLLNLWGLPSSIIAAIGGQSPAAQLESMDMCTTLQLAIEINQIIEDNEASTSIPTHLSKHMHRENIERWKYL